MLAIACLTSYRFYTGFLSATWIPYLLAMEGQNLFASEASIFMGCAKLIYGFTILLNPVFGMIGNQANAFSNSIGRRLVVRVGLTMAVMGIYICILAAQADSFLSFLIGILIWRLGEGINDVTTEALVPDIIPEEQWQATGGIKAGLFMLGGVVGYLMLLVLDKVHYSWLYLAYPLGMFVFAIPPIVLMSDESTFRPRKCDDSTANSLKAAYLDPINCKGGFPWCCLALFLFSLGTSPMFFMMLMVRDLVGVPDPVELQAQFCWNSLAFFLAAAVAALLLSVRDTGKRSPRQMAALLFSCMVICGLAVTAIPLVVLLRNLEGRSHYFLVINIIFGSAFGVVFGAFQQITWQNLPPQLNNTVGMGFSVMCRLFGVGVGNFLCGLMLLAFTNGISGAASGYTAPGYVVLCTFSAAAIFLSLWPASICIFNFDTQHTTDVTEK